jgi:RimJ/RimL family protein N-acetyltransferase
MADRKKEGYDMTETKRIRIYPASRAQMENMIASERDDDLKKAYGEMLEGSLAHPKERKWYALWMIEKADGTHIGDLCFKGCDTDRNPEIGYGILEAFQGRGYAAEAVGLALQWAFRHPEIKAVEAETDPDNIASQRVLEKCGFRPMGIMGEEGPRFIKYKETERDADRSIRAE